MTTIRPSKAERKTVDPPPRVDEREQIVNLRESGPIEAVSLPEDLVTTVCGMMCDIDTKLLAPELLGSDSASPALGLYEDHVRTWLDRDPVLRCAEVRFSGSGLHVLVWFKPAVELRDTGDRQRWRGMIKAVQSCLPTDPTAPALTALTRPIGSVNGKNQQAVARLREGTPVPTETFRALYERVRDKPFATVATLLYGSERVTPCPVCGADGRTLLASAKGGHCYGGCGSVKLHQLMATVMANPAEKGD
ncbi:hypothetical protein J8F10_16400 [Gemmata sp. G18]|uniref:Uncharacterized protein n=1 Tax=Gemmata palustris TaxID=2822762 RepID=A0ABS5BT31_9BACT|nr:hypothetical protein [Gemmata palustris]MBP3956854.1 hypothetical protein [Gemmata palustris]